MILPRVTADGVDLGDTGDGPHLRADNPVRQGPQILRRPFAAVGLSRAGSGFDREHENLAKPGGDRTHLRFDPRRELRLGRLDAFVDQLARKINVGAVLEYDSYLAEPITRNRARIGEFRQTRDGGFNRIGNALFGFERRKPFGLGVDLHLDVRDVRHGVDGQLGRTPRTERAQQSDDGEHEPALANGKTDDTGQHGLSPDQ